VDGRLAQWEGTTLQAEELKNWQLRLLQERDSLRRTLEQQKATTASTSFDLGGEISAHSSHMADQGIRTPLLPVLRI
jgi:hypothetical protein